jgi:ribosomal protein S18 acetylase RimI-like enzyme
VIQIIPATRTDLSLIETISIQTFTETFAPLNTAQNLATYISAHFNPTTLKNELGNAQSAFFLAKANNQIQRIYVLKEFQGQQIGQQLLLQAIAIAKNKKVASIWLGVWENNHKALQFYKKNGFEAFDKHVFTLGNEVQTDLLLRYQLNK